MKNSITKEATNELSFAQPQKIYLFETNQEELETILKSPFPDGNAPGYVYFVQEYMNGTFKIGKTKHIEKRMNLFNIKLPFENKLIYLIKTGNHHQTEVAFHKHFSSKRLEGEWFSLNRDDMNWIKSGKYTDEINYSISNNKEKDVNDKGKMVEESIKKEKPLTKKQIQYAKTMIQKLDQEYELMIDYSSLTNEDLSRLSVYFRFKNIGALNNLVKNGVLKKK
ncbi:GIY-YIG nuclease family protein [Psychrobacillus sp. FSL W7-1457]|uniref:GIY-YIG nuclease family protein n=1 Tax=unclassified Psychrobacillus TaxID=2636677 RepID=UPI0030F867D6